MFRLSKNKEMEKTEDTLVRYLQHDEEQREKDRKTFLEGIQKLLDSFFKNKMEEQQKKSQDGLKAAIALNMCMVSLSQIVDYNDINILKMEYDAILNNISIEDFPKDEALLDALKKILDTCHFYILHEKDKELLKEKQELRLKSALSNALKGGNIFAVVGSMNPYAIAAGVAVAVGIAAVNYKSQKKKAEFENKAEEWELQKSALEQLHNLRSTLFTTAWRLADAYNFKPDWRLSEKQIALYDEILTDPDAFSRYHRLKSIRDKFEAYPPFYYYMGHAALEYAIEDERNHENQTTPVSKKMRKNAQEALDIFSEKNRECHLLREDLLTASGLLDYCEILKDDRVKVLSYVELAHKLAGFDFPTLQNCAFRYLSLTCENDGKKKISDKISKKAEDKAISILELLVHENYNLSINARLLSKLYIELHRKDDYAILDHMISKRFSFFKYRHILPWEKTDGYQARVFAFFAGAGKAFEKNVLSPFMKAELHMMYQDLLQALRNAEQCGRTGPVKEYFDRHPLDDEKEVFSAGLRGELFNTMGQMLHPLPEHVQHSIHKKISSYGETFENKVIGDFFDTLVKLNDYSRESSWIFWDQDKCLEQGAYENCRDNFEKALEDIASSLSAIMQSCIKEYIDQSQMTPDLQEQMLLCLDQWQNAIYEKERDLRLMSK